MAKSFAAPLLRSEMWGSYHIVPVPSDCAEALLASGTRRVIAVLNGHTVRRALTSHDGGTVLILGTGLMRAIGVATGDTVLVDLSPDPEPDRVDLGDAFAAVLADDAEASERFFSFPPGKQRSLAFHVTSAKRAETRIRRALDLAEKIRMHTLYGDTRPE